eukprot:366485-Chlamydomonas_euryale.AAC.10
MIDLTTATATKSARPPALEAKDTGYLLSLGRSRNAANLTIQKTTPQFCSSIQRGSPVGSVDRQTTRVRGLESRVKGDRGSRGGCPRLCPLVRASKMKSATPSAQSTLGGVNVVASNEQSQRCAQ